jgi:hypothetical protein
MTSKSNYFSDVRVAFQFLSKNYMLPGPADFLFALVAVTITPSFSEKYSDHPTNDHFGSLRAFL